MSLKSFFKHRSRCILSVSRKLRPLYMIHVSSGIHITKSHKTTEDTHFNAYGNYQGRSLITDVDFQAHWNI